MLAIDYRGFGKSSERAATSCRPRSAPTRTRAPPGTGSRASIRTQRRYIFGHSLGSAIAVNLASEVADASGLIVEGSFTSIPDVFADHALGLAAGDGPLITQRFDAGEPHRQGPRAGARRARQRGHG